MADIPTTVADASPLLAMDNIDQLDLALLSDVLISGGHATGRIASYSHKSVGAGLLGSSFMLFLTYAAGASGPDKLVIKMHCEEPSGRKIARYGYRLPGGYGFYKAETIFFQRLAPMLSIRVPGCFGAAVSEDGSRMVLLLEAIHPAEPGDDIQGCTAEQLEMAVRNIAGLHAPSWNMSIDQLEPGTYDAQGSTSHLRREQMIAACKAFPERWSNEFDSATFDRFNRFADFYDTWQRAEGRARALVHTDHRMDNLMFFSSHPEVVVLDWQTYHLGLPLRDIGQLFAASITAELRRAEEGRMLRLYHETLLAKGVTGYSFDRLMSDYYWSLYQGLHGTLFGMMAFALQGRGRELFLTKLRRTLVTLEDYRDHMEFDFYG